MSGWAALASLVLVGCVTGRFERVTVNAPVPSAALAGLTPGTDTLGTCLAALGAPVTVVECDVGPGLKSGVAIAYSWIERSGWGFTVNVPRVNNAYFSFDSLGTDVPGCVLWFDERLVLQRWREGLVGSLLPARRRPAPVLGAN